MEDFSEIIDWENIFKNSEKFKNNKPFKFQYIENFFKKKYYTKLRETYPKIDESWGLDNAIGSYKYHKTYGLKTSEITGFENDSSISEEWKKFLRYLNTKEFADNIKKFSDLNVTKTKYAGFTAYKKGGFHIPHIHNNGENCLIILCYFNQNWPKGEGGGTYVATEEDESTMIFEPDNLDNTMMVFQDGPKAAHGVRYITKDVVRQGFQFELQNYSIKNGWSGEKGYENLISELEKE